MLLEKGADIEARDFNLWMPLDCAAAYGRPKCAKMLLEAGASVDPVDKVLGLGLSQGGAIRPYLLFLSTWGLG